MKHLLTTTALIASISLTQPAPAAENDAQLNKQIEQYILDHPEVIVRSLQQFQVRQEANRIKEQTRAVKEVVKDFEQDDLHYGEAGNPDGDVLIVEFFDYNCPACKMMFESIDALLAKDNQVRVVFVEYPIFGPVSDENAKISMAVAELAPDKYYRFHQALMRQKGKINADLMLSTAANLGIDKEQLKQEYQKDKYDALIEKDRELAQKLKISGTPAAIIGEKMANGALSLQQLETHVRWARDDKEE